MCPARPQPERLVLNLPSLEGWKAELTEVAGYIPRLFICPKTVTHPSTNRARCRATVLAETNRSLQSHVTSKISWLAMYDQECNPLVFLQQLSCLTAVNNNACVSSCSFMPSRSNKQVNTKPSNRTVTVFNHGCIYIYISGYRTGHGC